MKKCYTCLCFYISLLFTVSLHAQPLPPLKVATNMFVPPFVMHSANNQLFGFDIELMESICKILNRTCIYEPVKFEYVLERVKDNTADIGIGSVTITLERAKQVAFSIPYLLSYAQYISLKSNHSKNFSTDMLNHKKVGVKMGSTFKNSLTELGLPNLNIIEMKDYTYMIKALEDKQLDYALMDASSARYWQTQTKGKLAANGKPFLYGYGFGIVVNIKNRALLEDINSALLEYQNTGGFQKAYNRYIAQF